MKILGLGFIMVGVTFWSFVVMSASRSHIKKDMSEKDFWIGVFYGLLMPLAGIYLIIG